MPLQVVHDISWPCSYHTVECAASRQLRTLASEEKPGLAAAGCAGGSFIRTDELDRHENLSSHPVKHAKDATTKHEAT